MPYKDPQKKKEWDAQRDRRGNTAVKLYNASPAGKMSQQKYRASLAGNKAGVCRYARQAPLNHETTYKVYLTYGFGVLNDPDVELNP